MGAYLLRRLGTSVKIKYLLMRYGYRLTHSTAGMLFVRNSLGFRELCLRVLPVLNPLEWVFCDSPQFIRGGCLDETAIGCIKVQP